MRVVIIGCGFLGEAAAVSFSEAGAKVLGLCATPATASRLAGRAFQVLDRDIAAPLKNISSEWHRPDLLIHCASSGGGGAAAYRTVYRDGLENTLRFFDPLRVIFTGSTSVYGQQSGEWVTEDSATEPVSETGGILLEAEALALDAGGIVARLSGLYGPGRCIYLEKFLSGQAVIEEAGERWINQIHRDDVVRALVALGRSGIAPGIYNVNDHHPVTQAALYGELAKMFQRPLPSVGPRNPHARRAWTNKRVSNEKLRSTGWNPLYPTLRDAIVAGAV